jgi:hypothetical protein
MKAVAVALGFSAAGALHAPTVAEPTWSKCFYDCGAGDPEGRCMPTRCRTFIHEQGTYCPASIVMEDLCCASSKADCEAEVFTPPPSA